jgi:hypothetical protein
MSWRTCYSGSNNIHFDYPPIMMDGRNFADWQPGAVINERIRQDANIKTNADYRKYLSNNADNIIKYNQLQACDQCCTCPARYGTEQSQTNKNTPYLYKSCYDNSMPFGYETSDLKNAYLSRNQLQCRMVTPILTQAQYLQQGYPNAN